MTMCTETVLCTYVTSLSVCTFVQNISITLQITDDFWKVIIHCDVISCVICISSKIEYLQKE